MAGALECGSRPLSSSSPGFPSHGGLLRFLPHPAGGAHGAARRQPRPPRRRAPRPPLRIRPPATRPRPPPGRSHLQSLRFFRPSPDFLFDLIVHLPLLTFGVVRVVRCAKGGEEQTRYCTDHLELFRCSS